MYKRYVIKIGIVSTVENLAASQIFNTSNIDHNEPKIKHDNLFFVTIVNEKSIQYIAIYDLCEKMYIHKSAIDFNHIKDRNEFIRLIDRLNYEWRSYNEMIDSTFNIVAAGLTL